MWGYPVLLLESQLLKGPWFRILCNHETLAGASLKALAPSLTAQEGWEP